MTKNLIDPRSPFGKQYKPQADWTPVQQRATRTSSMGDSLNLKSAPAKWVKTKRAPR